MRQKLTYLLTGVLIGAMLCGGTALATQAVKSINVSYENIKVYKDNVLCELKDANGTVVEPFIYNGTTFMPVRGTANLAGMQVTWDGPTHSVYLWDDMVLSGTSFMEVCPPYQKSDMSTYYATNGSSFTMAGERYSDGLKSNWNNANALFNLNSKYSELQCTIGHIDGYANYDRTVSFIVDGKVVKEFELDAECLPKKVSIPLKYGLQLKIVAGDCVGIGNMTVE